MLYAKKICALQQEALQHVKNNKIYKTLNFGFSEDLAAFFVPYLFESFHAIHPNIFLNMLAGHSTDILQKFSNKALDICVVKEFTENKYLKPKLFYEDELVWISKINLDLEQYNNFIPLILSPSPSILTSRVLGLLDKNFLNYRVVLSSTSFACKIAATESGIGVTVAPASHIISNNKITLIPDLPKLGKVQISTYSLINGYIENDLAMIINKLLNPKDLNTT